MKTQLISLIGVMAGVLLLSACDASMPSHVQARKIRLQERMVAENLDPMKVNKGHVAAVANRFRQKGRGDMVLTMSYLSGDKKSQARADRVGAAYKKALTAEGVPHVSLVTVPVKSADNAAEAIITYNGLIALPAENCGAVPGHNGAATPNEINDYPIGCGMQAAIGKMIANPSDLMGKGGTQNNDSRRSGTIIEPYKSGTPNGPMGGFDASGLGGG